MTIREFRDSLAGQEPTSAAPLIRALWHDARGDWHAAHALAQRCDTVDGAWVHAYLHRKEGDLANARYWYGRANRPAFAGPLEDEWEQLVRALLGTAQ